MHNIVRSNDMILGFPHDVAGFALLQRILAARLGVGIGRYAHSISNAHIYDVHYQAAEEIIARVGQHEEIELVAHPDWFARAEQQDNTLVEQIATILGSQYNPQPAIKGLQIVI